MKEQAFASWLENVRGMKGNSRRSRIFNCRRVETFEGDLDDHFRVDRIQGLLKRLQYSRQDEVAKAAARHRIPINGNCYNGTATLRSAVTLYVEFCTAPGGEPAVFSAPGVNRPRTVVERTTRSDWPTWEAPSPADVLILAGLVTRFTRFLHPTIVAAIVQDNEDHREAWSARLRQRGVDPELYLWPRSACVFPGVRRHVGAKEIATFRERASGQPSQALRLDDNTYPKHLWSFVFRGKPFQNQGPSGYALAHLVDHKEYKSRTSAEFECMALGAQRRAHFGLFTSATNSVYAPTSFIRPTDFAGPLRNLLQRRALALYGGFCQFLPEGLKIRPGPFAEWDLERFPWSDPVGDIGYLGRFLEFRRQEMEKLLDV